ncbi:MAG: hypothetical protein WDM70_01060 [Nitrosomonadales bacterium]
MSRELAATRGEENILHIAVKHVAEVFEAQGRGITARRNGTDCLPET